MTPYSLTTFFLIIIFNAFSQQSDCSNIDFENGNLDNWISEGNIELVNKDQTDYYGNFPLALSGYYGVKLGNNANSILSSLTKTITITENNKFFIYGFAIVLLGYPHTEEDASFVKLTVTDENGIDVPCTQYTVFAESSVGNGFQQSPQPNEPNLGSECCYPIFYKPWEITALDMSDYIGQTFTFKLESDWCIFDVDWGYAYVDAYCSGNFFNEYVNCEDGLMYLSAVAGLQSYTWAGPGIVSGQGTNEIQINEEGLYNLFIPSPNPNCEPLNLNYDATNDVEPDIPIADFNESPFMCVSIPINFTNESVSASYFTSVEWDFGDGDTSNLFSPSHTYDTTGIFVITLIVTNESNCTDSIFYSSSLINAPILELGADLILCDNEELEIIPESHSMGNSYNWSNGATTSTIMVDSPQQIILEYSNGCSVFDTIQILDLGYKFGQIPNVITANEDGVNDEFVISSNYLAEYSIVITNRWGNVIFKSDDPTMFWEGNFNGELVTEGVYFYLINYRLTCQDSLHKKHGHVTVIH